MKPYGVDRKDSGCCPGHDKFPNETYNNRRSKKARALARQIAHKRARARDVQALKKQIANISNEELDELRMTVNCILGRDPYDGMP